MMISHTLRRRIAQFLLLNFIALSVSLPAAQAGLVGTDQVLAAEQAQADRTRLSQLLQREDLIAQLQAAGVEPAQVRARVDALSDGEVAAITDQLDQQPAGGDILGIAVFIFLVLLVTDILGYTEIFPFVKKTAH